MGSRSKNFSVRDKYFLLSLVDKYKSIIENKLTNLENINKKQEAWDQITIQFNATAEVPRGSKQLRTAYLNLKRRTRKKDADDNDNTQDTDPLDVEDIEELKSSQTDKEEIRATEGTYKPLLDDAGAIIMNTQIKPLENSCDSASQYYFMDENTMTFVQEYDDVDKEKTNTTSVVSAPQSSQMPLRDTYRTKPPHILKSKKNDDNKLIKKKIYQTKLNSAIIEKKTKLVEYNAAILKKKMYDLELKIKKKIYENLAINMNSV